MNEFERLIKDLIKTGESVSSIAVKTGVCRMTIYHMLNGQRSDVWLSNYRALTELKADNLKLKPKP